MPLRTNILHSIKRYCRKENRREPVGNESPLHHFNLLPNTRLCMMPEQIRGCFLIVFEYLYERNHWCHYSSDRYCCILRPIWRYKIKKDTFHLSSHLTKNPEDNECHEVFSITAYETMVSPHSWQLLHTSTGTARRKYIFPYTTFKGKRGLFKIPLTHCFIFLTCRELIYSSLDIL